MKHTGIVLYVLLYAVGALIYLTLTAEIYFANYQILILPYGSMLLVCVFLAAVVLAIIRRSWQKTLALASFIAIGAAAIALAPAARSTANLIFLENRLPEMRKLVVELDAIEQLGEVRVGGEYAWIHYGPPGELVTQSEFLRRTGIDRHLYMRLVGEIDSLGFYLAEVRQDWIAFHRGGFLDNVCGIMYVKPGRPKPVRRDRVWLNELWVLDRVKGNWYYFETT